MNPARLVHPGFWFGKTPLEEALALAKRGVGGFCLYGGTRAEVAAFTAQVRSVSPLNHLLISADYEDGLGRWLPDAPLLPSNMALGAADDENLAFEKGLLTAKQARSLGVDWVFAPVLDLADNPLNPIVNTRSFGEDPARVIRLGRAFLRGLKQGGVLNSVKHFPGHGDTITDSHLALPVLHRSEAQLFAHELVPFQALLPLADSVMLGHLALPELDPDHPASLSIKIAHGLLREKLHYSGCVLTDALLMKAIGDEKQAARAALQAGANILLVPQDPNALIDFLEKESVAPEIYARSQAVQDALCARVKAVPAPSQQIAFAPSDFVRNAARKAIAARGTLPVFKPGETISYLEIGTDGKTSAAPFLAALRAHGVQPVAFNGETENLLILCLRRYQAFQGKIALEDKDEQLLRQALAHATHTTAVLFASPWALAATPVEHLVFTFSPAPEFQQTAAEILCGKQKAAGQLPVSL